MPAVWLLPAEFAALLASLAHQLDARSAARLTPLVVGVLFATGRRTVASWLRACGAGLDFRPYYYLLTVLGERAERLGDALRERLLELLPKDAKLTLVIDDTPTPRFGPFVEGCGRHRDPTPGPAGHGFLYGHVWTTAALAIEHPRWGTIALPYFASLYIRRRDLPKVPAKRGVGFQTKLEHAVAMIESFGRWAQARGRPARLLVDGAYATRQVLAAAKAFGIVVVSRLRRNAALHDVPGPPTGKRGRPRLYGPERLDLAKRGAHPGGWTEAEVPMYGRPEPKRFKTFLATWKPARGPIRVVMVREQAGWLAFFTTDLAATAASVLTAVAARGAIEQCFHALKEVVGAGQQQLRNLWANVGSFNLCLWVHSLTELWAWRRPKSRLVDRRNSPWDDPDRRPSPADRRRSLRRESLDSEYSQLPPRLRRHPKIRRLVEKLAAAAS